MGRMDGMDGMGCMDGGDGDGGKPAADQAVFMGCPLKKHTIHVVNQRITHI